MSEARVCKVIIPDSPTVYSMITVLDSLIRQLHRYDKAAEIKRITLSGKERMLYVEVEDGG